MKGSKTEISTKEDIEHMVKSFYTKVNQDPILSPVFNEVAQVNWEEHLPKIYQFWNSLLLGQQAYKGNPFAAHIPLPIDERHFSRWVQLFEDNINEFFYGEVAEQAMLRARSIAHIFQSKLSMIRSVKGKK